MTRPPAVWLGDMAEGREAGRPAYRRQHRLRLGPVWLTFLLRDGPSPAERGRRLVCLYLAVSFHWPRPRRARARARPEVLPRPLWRLWDSQEC